MDLEHSVETYYNNNTKRFLKYGQGGKTLSIHRAVFAADSTGTREAFRFHENKILKIIEREEISLVVDLGCGTGGSISYLNSLHPSTYHGITISSVQAEIAEYLTEKPNITVICGSYLDQKSYSDIQGKTGKRLFFAIESYLHCQDREKFFDILSLQTKQGDILVIVDDFKISEDSIGKKDLRDINDFTLGWHAAELQSLKEVLTLSKTKGFTIKENIELTQWLDINRPRDYLIAFFVPLLRMLKLKNSWWQNLLGGNALRKGLTNGWLSYRFLVWERSSR